MTTPLLQAKDLRISFYGVQAADGVNLEIDVLARYLQRMEHYRGR